MWETNDFVIQEWWNIFSVQKFLKKTLIVLYKTKHTFLYGLQVVSMATRWVYALHWKIVGNLMHAITVVGIKEYTWNWSNFLTPIRPYVPKSSSSNLSPFIPGN